MCGDAQEQPSVHRPLCMRCGRWEKRPSGFLLSAFFFLCGVFAAGFSSRRSVRVLSARCLSYTPPVSHVKDRKAAFCHSLSLPLSTCLLVSVCLPVSCLSSLCLFFLSVVEVLARSLSPARQRSRRFFFLFFSFPLESRLEKPSSLFRYAYLLLSGPVFSFLLMSGNFFQLSSSFSLFPSVDEAPRLLLLLLPLSPPSSHSVALMQTSDCCERKTCASRASLCLSFSLATSFRRVFVWVYCR